MGEDYRLRDQDKIVLRKCNINDLSVFMPAEITRYYPNSLCIADPGSVEINGNWFNKQFKSIQIMIEECVGLGCKTRDEIATFMRNNLFYFIS